MIHVGIANRRWRWKRSRHSRRMRNPHFFVCGKRPTAVVQSLLYGNNIIYLGEKGCFSLLAHQLIIITKIVCNNQIENIVSHCLGHGQSTMVYAVSFTLFFFYKMSAKNVTRNEMKNRMMYWEEITQRSKLFLIGLFYAYYMRFRYFRSWCRI